ncbi:MAG: hypothetical protein ACLTQG_25195 [Hungatella sp.]|uniref:hypothetical protein n=1 Tax=Hungatella sp. TaxID=2613924 RepID=UPI0039929AC6
MTCTENIFPIHNGEGKQRGIPWQKGEGAAGAGAGSEKVPGGKAVFAAVLKVILVLLIAAGLLFSSTYVYRYWEGSRTSTTPLETGREIVPETMKIYE